MRIRLLLLFLTASSANLTFAQQNTDTLAFNNRVSRMMNQWVVFPKANNSDKYPYGFIYLDQIAGFTFELTGNFTIVNNKYVIDTAVQKKLKVSMMKYRLAPNTKLVAILPAKHYADLDITGTPNWVKLYNTYSDTLKYNVAVGRHLNSLNDCQYALSYLLKTYKVKPHETELEFEMAYAYNLLHQFDDAIKVLEPAIKNNPSDIFLYKELGFAHLEQKDIDKAIAVFTDGIAACGDQHLNEKAEMALNIGSGYRYLKNDALYKEWVAKAKSWAPVGSDTHKRLVQLGF